MRAARDTTRPAPGLSKSRYQAGLQCPKRLWLECYRRELADAIDEATQALFDQGHRVGELARERFGGGVLVAEDYTRSAAALATTERLLLHGAECLYEPAFRYDGVFVRCDILVRRPDGWDLIEVKSTSKAKPEHVTDCAIQAYVAQGFGLPIARAYVMHLDTDYVYAGGPYDLEQLFRLVDVTAEVRRLLPDIPRELAQMKAILLADCPERTIGGHCSAPYDCGFIGHCHAFLPDYPVTEIPRIKPEVVGELLAAGIYGIHDVPPNHPVLTPLQRTVCHVIQSGEPRYGNGLADELARLAHPIHFLDFETWMPALPVHPGTRPYQMLPVQWSCHTLHADGTITHQEFLHEEPSDPRPAFAESLLAALESEATGVECPIVVYTGFENRVLRSLAEELPEWAPRIEALQTRLVDLEKMIRNHVQHPGFHGRTSLKFVLPAIVDDISYDGLAIANGAVATRRYEAAILDGLGDLQRRQIFADLRAYCAVDTLGMVRLVEELVERCS